MTLTTGFFTGMRRREEKTAAAATLFREQTEVTLVPHVSPTTWRCYTNPASVKTTVCQMEQREAGSRRTSDRRVRRPSSGQDVDSGSKSTPELKWMQPD